MKQLFTLLVILIFAQLSTAQRLTDFEDIEIEADTFVDGREGIDGFDSGNAFFPIRYDTSFGGFWASGWAVSSKLDSVNASFRNLFSAKTARGHLGSQNYIVGQQNAVIELTGPAAGEAVQGFYITNSTFAHGVIRDGNQFAKPFGGENGDDPDFFKLSIRKYYEGTLSEDSIDFYLADYRFEDNTKDYIVDEWEYVDLFALGKADSLLFTLSSSDVSSFGINTPLFFCLDNLITEARMEFSNNRIGFEETFIGLDTFRSGEDQSGGFFSNNGFFPNVYSQAFGGFWAAGWALSSKMDSVNAVSGNLFAAKPARGVEGSINYAVGQQNAIIDLSNLPVGMAPEAISITNSTFAHGVMREGNQFSKPFGGESGDDPDFFKLVIKKYLNGEPGTDSIAFFLADYRFEDNAADFIVDTWKEVDLSSLGRADSLRFTLSSSDVGDFGINTPLFFCIDNLRFSRSFAPAAGQEGSTALAADSSIFVAWATDALIEKGPLDITNPDIGVPPLGDASDALGPANGFGVVSLGDGGMATMTFELPIMNGPGADFAVFENGFAADGGYFLELAFVEVSSDGETFIRFPSVSLTDTSRQIGNFDVMDPTKIHNLAGKYEGAFGTPFDLEELSEIDAIDVDRITHVRIIDVVGSLNAAYARMDSEGNIINDPWPTDFQSGGFDLDAIGVIHQNTSVDVEKVDLSMNVTISPNPIKVGQFLTIQSDIFGQQNFQIKIYDLLGRVISIKEETSTSISTKDLEAGTYFITLEGQGKRAVKPLVVVK